MAFAVPIGVTAVLTGLGWFVKKRADALSLDWEDRVVFYDYNTDTSQSIDTVQNYDNGHIVDIEILHKKADGCISWTALRAIPIDHTVLVMKTNMDQYWSIEKNNKAIYVQKSKKDSRIRDYLDGNKRVTPLLSDSRNWDKYMSKYNINKIKPVDIANKMIKINGIITFLIKKEKSIKFSHSENCQKFLQRVLDFIINGLDTSLVFYDYSLKKSLPWNQVYTSLPKNVFISDVKWLYKPAERNNSKIQTIESNEFVGFLVNTNIGQYWSFEQDFECVHIQRSPNEIMLLKMLNGEPRDTCLKRGNFGFDDSSFGVISETPLSPILQVFNYPTSIRSDLKEFIEDSLRSVYDPRQLVSTGLAFYDYEDRKSKSILSSALHLSGTSIVTNIQLLSCHNNKSDGNHRDNGIVLMITTTDDYFWSIERNKNVTHVQKSMDYKTLRVQFKSVMRETPLVISHKCEGNLTLIKMTGLLEFIIEFHRRYNNECENIIDRIMQYFRCYVCL